MITIFKMDPKDEITFPPSSRDISKCYETLRWLRDNKMEFSVVAIVSSRGLRYSKEKVTVKDLRHRELQVYDERNSAMWFFLSNIYSISVYHIDPED